HVCTLRSPLRSPLFPYTTLFRSVWWRRMYTYGMRSNLVRKRIGIKRKSCRAKQNFWKPSKYTPLPSTPILPQARHILTTILKNRSEEHTSELQSRENLVCRLLLE